MNLQEELFVLKSYMGGKNPEEFKKKSDYIRATFTSKEEQMQVDDFIASVFNEISSRTENLIKEAESLLIREQLKEVSEIVSMSYVAKKYFNKDRSWIYQKINGNLKNGKFVKFTDSEIGTFNFALQDISKKIGSVAIHS